MRYNTLKRNSEFARGYKRGKSYVHKHVVVYINNNNKQGVRIGFTATKKVGKATVRNRARRVLKHALNTALTPQIMQRNNIDIILVARGLTPKIKSTQMAKTLTEIFKNAKI